MNGFSGSDFVLPGEQDEINRKIREYLRELDQSGYPLQFSETGIKNLAARFKVTVEEFTLHVAAYQAEAGRHVR